MAKAAVAVLDAGSRKDGYLEGGGYIVSWCFGHLVELAQPDAYDEKYGKWRYNDLPIIPGEWKHTVPEDKQGQLKTLSRLMKRPDVDTIVNTCDAGREGELIFRFVYDYCKCTKPIQRLWISSMEESAIVEGFQNLKPGAEYEHLYQSALCRMRTDWLVGINATRLFSVLYGATLNVGRLINGRGKVYCEYTALKGQFEKAYAVRRDAEQLVRELNRPRQKQRDSRSREMER